MIFSKVNRFKQVSNNWRLPWNWAGGNHETQNSRMSTQHTRIYEHKFRCNGYLTVWSAVSFSSLGYFYKTIWSSSYCLWCVWCGGFFFISMISLLLIWMISLIFWCEWCC